MAQLEVNSTSKGLNIGVWVSNLDIFWIIQDSKVRAIGARKHSSNKTILHEKNPRVCVDLIYISYASLDDKNCTCLMMTKLGMLPPPVILSDQQEPFRIKNSTQDDKLQEIRPFEGFETEPNRCLNGNQSHHRPENATLKLPR